MPATLLAQIRPIFIMYDCMVKHIPEQPERHYFHLVRSINSRLVTWVNQYLPDRHTSGYSLRPRRHNKITKTSELKGELNLDKKWQSDDLFLYNNERNSPSFQPILRDFKVIVIYFKKILTFKYRQFSLIPLSMSAGVCKQQRPKRMANFLRGYD